MCYFDYNRETPPIGHGGMAIENIKPWKKQGITLIFDCGSKQQSILSKEIKKQKFEGKVTLVISHFHEDHFNGIKDLIETTKIHRLIVPHIDDKEKFLLASISSPEFRKFIFDPRSIFNNNDISIITISHSESVIRQDLPRMLSSIENTRQQLDNLEYGILADGENNDLKCYWGVKFYVNPLVYENLESKDNDFLKGLLEHDMEDDAKLKKAIDIYNKISNNKINTTTMMMASYPICWYNDILCIHYLYYHSDKMPGVLYTGDLPIKTQKMANNIFKHYSKCYKHIFTMSVPHHGSDRDFKVLPLPFINEAYVQASAGDKKHPGKGTKALLKEMRIKLNIIRPKKTI